MINNLEDFICKIEGFMELSNSERIDYFVYYLIILKGKSAIKPKEILECFSEISIPPYSNIPKYLSDNSRKIKGQQKYIRSKKDVSYKLTRETVLKLSKNINVDSQTIVVNTTLRGLLNNVKIKSESVFLEEAIKTFEVEAYRASILMVWLLTLDHLFEYILAEKLTEFIAALRRANINKSIYTKDDFGDIKESQFIEICRSANIISNDVRKILDSKLGIRNSFAHPSTVVLPKSKALDFIEDLLQNVVLKY